MTTLATPTLTQEYLTKVRPGLVPAILKGVKYAKIGGNLVALIAIIATYGHQAGHLSSHGFGWTAFVVPGAFDLGMVVMVVITQTPAMHREAKARALKVLILLVLISMAINAELIGNPRVIFPLLVAVIGLTKWVTSAIRPDFSAMEAKETELAEVAPVTRTLTQAQKDQRNATRAANLAAKAQAKADAAERRRLARELKTMETTFANTVAPVSPAPTLWTPTS